MEKKKKKIFFRFESKKQNVKVSRSYKFDNKNRIFIILDCISECYRECINNNVFENLTCEELEESIQILREKQENLVIHKNQTKESNEIIEDEADKQSDKDTLSFKDNDSQEDNNLKDNDENDNNTQSIKKDNGSRKRQVNSFSNSNTQNSSHPSSKLNTV